MSEWTNIADGPPIRGGVYRQEKIDREFLVISVDTLNQSGTVIVVEVVEDKAWSDSRNLLVVAVDPVDQPQGRVILAWRLNYMRADRLGKMIGAVNDDTMDQVTTAVQAAIEPLR